MQPIRNRPARAVVLGLALLALVGLTEDFGWAHTVHVDRLDWNYRLHYDRKRAQHYYPRRDYRTPAEVVNRRAKPNDLIITATLPVAHYLERMDYVYRNFRDGEFVAISCDRGKHERWTGSRLLYRRTDLFTAIDAAPADVWLIDRGNLHLPPDNELTRRYAAPVVYRGRGGKIWVYKISKSK